MCGILTKPKLRVVKLTKGDKVLIVIVIVLSLLSLGYVRRYSFSGIDKYISVQVNGEEVKRIMFDSKLVGKTFPIESSFGYNLIEIGDQQVRVIEASCPDEIDVKQGYISQVGETIICLPNRMVVEIKGMDNFGDIDIINH